MKLPARNTPRNNHALSDTPRNRVHRDQPILPPLGPHMRLTLQWYCPLWLFSLYWGAYKYAKNYFSCLAIYRRNRAPPTA